MTYYHQEQSFEKYWFSELCQSPKCWHISLHSMKITFVNIINYLSEKSLSIGKYKFSKTLIFVSNLGIYHWQQIRLFSLKSQAHIVLFSRQYLQILSLNNSTLFSANNSFQVKMVLHGKSSYLVHISNNCINVIPHDNITWVCRSTSFGRSTFYLVTKNIKKGIQVSSVIKLFLLPRLWHS